MSVENKKQDHSEYIESIASEFRSKVNTAFESENNVTSLLRKTVDALGGRILETDNPEFYEVNGGSLKINKTGNFVIKLPVYTSPLRDNFTIAHELGHYILHYKDEMGEKVYARLGSSQEEIQANRFAAAFLMPKEKFIQARKELDDSVYRLAARFQVSIDAVRVRMEYIK